MYVWRAAEAQLHGMLVNMSLVPSVMVVWVGGSGDVGVGRS